MPVRHSVHRERLGVAHNPGTSPPLPRRFALKVPCGSRASTLKRFLTTSQIVCSGSYERIAWPKGNSASIKPRLRRYARALLTHAPPFDRFEKLAPVRSVTRKRSGSRSASPSRNKAASCENIASGWRVCWMHIPSSHASCDR